jgi:hypothetical protein
MMTVLSKMTNGVTVVECVSASTSWQRQLLSRDATMPPLLASFSLRTEDDDHLILNRVAMSRQDVGDGVADIGLTEEECSSRP